MKSTAMDITLPSLTEIQSITDQTDQTLFTDMSDLQRATRAEQLFAFLLTDHDQLPYFHDCTADVEAARIPAAHTLGQLVLAAHAPRHGELTRFEYRPAALHPHYQVAVASGIIRAAMERGNTADLADSMELRGALEQALRHARAYHSAFSDKRFGAEIMLWVERDLRGAFGRESQFVIEQTASVLPLG